MHILNTLAHIGLVVLCLACFAGGFLAGRVTS